MIRKIKFLKTVVVITIFATFFSCSDDLVPVEQDKKELKFEWNTKTFDELKNNQKFSKSYNQVTEKISEKRNSINSRTVMEDTFNFTIDSTSIYEVVAEGYTSYTFSIFRDNQPNINYTYYENLFIEIDSTNIPQASILKYNLGSDHSVTSIESNKIIYNSNTAGKILYNGGDGDGCTTVTIYYVETCGCPGQHWPGDPTCTCYSSPPTSTFLNSYTSCPGSGGGGTTTTGVLTFHPHSSGGSYSTTSLSVTNPYSYVSQRRKSLKQTYPAGLTYNSAVYNWLMQQNETTQGVIYGYLESQVNLNGLLSTSTVYPQAAIELVNWGINFLINNPSVSIQNFQNWFLTPREGFDFDYDDVFWENPSLTFPQQNLPSWNDFSSAYPKNSDGSWMTGADNVYSFVGGAVQQARISSPNETENTCALKVSIALNGSGINIPNIPGKTLQGSGQFANQYFFLNARALNKWMRKTFGTTSNPNFMTIPASQITPFGENLPTLLTNVKGIYSLVRPLGSTWASGHADIIENTSCAAGCHFSDAPIEYIDIWKLN